MRSVLFADDSKKDSHVHPNKWNKLIKEKDTVLIDARKPFEYQVGTFKSSINKKYGSNFNKDNFDHNAFFNSSKDRIEMHLISNKLHSVNILD